MTRIRPLPETTVRTSAATLAVVAALAALLLALLVLHNVHGPLRDHLGWAQVVAWAIALMVGLGAYAAARVLLRRWWPSVPIVVLGVIAVGWVLGPRQIDETPSFVPGPGPTHTCSGWTVEHYPPETFDASSVTYCFGIEEPV